MVFRHGKRLLSLEAEEGPEKGVAKTQNSTGTNIQYCGIKPVNVLEIDYSLVAK